jgi:hypothetical protein
MRVTLDQYLKDNMKDSGADCLLVYLALKRLMAGEDTMRVTLDQYLKDNMKDLGIDCLLVYLALKRLMAGEDTCAPSVVTLSKYSGCAMRTVWSSLKTLLEYGVIEMVERDLMPGELPGPTRWRLVPIEEARLRLS